MPDRDNTNELFIDSSLGTTKGLMETIHPIVADDSYSDGGLLQDIETEEDSNCPDETVVTTKQ